LLVPILERTDTTTTVPAGVGISGVPFESAFDVGSAHRAAVAMVVNALASNPSVGWMSPRWQAMHPVIYLTLLGAMTGLESPLLPYGEPYLHLMGALEGKGPYIIALANPNTTTDPLLEISFEPAFRQLNRLRRLGANWDSYGAEPISGVAVERAHALLRLVRDLLSGWAGYGAHPYAIAPLADGGVQVEWRSPRGDLEVEIGPDGSLGYLLEQERDGKVQYLQVDRVPAAIILSKLSDILTY